MHNPPEASAPWCLFLCRGAEPRHTVIVLSVILSDQADSRRLLKIKRYKTSNISRTQYLLGSDLKNFGSCVGSVQKHAKLNEKISYTFWKCSFALNLFYTFSGSWH